MRSGRSSAFAAVVVLIALRAHAAGLVVEPSRVYLTASAGSSVDQDIALSSADGGSVRVAFAIEAFTLDIDGKPLHRRTSQLADSVSLSESSAFIRAGEKHVVHIHLTLPPNAAGTTWFALMIDVQSDDGVRVASRVGVPIFVSAEETEVWRAEIGDVRAVRTSTDEVEITALVHNSGNSVLRRPATFAIESGDSEIASREVPPFVVLPGGDREIHVRVHGAFGEGRLTVAAFYRYGEAKDQTAAVSAIVLPR